MYMCTQEIYYYYYTRTRAVHIIYVDEFICIYLYCIIPSQYDNRLDPVF